MEYLEWYEKGYLICCYGCAFGLFLMLIAKVAQWIRGDDDYE